jgi:hypothetical protein
MNMIPMLRYGKPVAVYFDADHNTARVTNICAIDTSDATVIHLTDADREALAEQIAEEIAISIIEVASYKAAGRLLEA